MDLTKYINIISFHFLRSLSLTLILLVAQGNSYSQSLNVDSLKQVWGDEAQADTVRFNALQKIAWDVFVYSEPDSAYHYAQIQFDFAEKKELKEQIALALHTQGTVWRIRGEYDKALEYLQPGLKISEEIDDKSGISRSYNSIGIAYEMQGQYDEALDYYTRSLQVGKEIGNKRGSAYTLGNIGIVYQIQGNLAKAVDYYSKSLKIHEEIDNKNGIAISLNNIGLIYENIGDYPKALDYYARCLEIAMEKGFKQEIATILNNIGVIHETQGDYVRAMDFHTRGLKVSEEAGYSYGITSSLIDIGIIYQLQGDYTLAMDYCVRGLSMAEELDNKRIIAYALNNIAIIYIKQGQFTNSLDYSKRALISAKDVGAISQIKTAAGYLHRAYQQLGDYKASLQMHELYIEMRDSIENMEGQKEIIRQEFEYYYEKQAIADSVEFAKQRELDVLTMEAKQDKERYAWFGVFALLLISMGVYVRIRFIKRQAERNLLLQEIKTLKVARNIGLTKSISNNGNSQLDKEKIESAISSSLNLSDWKILNALYHNPAVGNKEIADQVSLSIEGVRSSLKKMYSFFYIENTANRRVVLVLEAAKLSNPILDQE